MMHEMHESQTAHNNFLDGQGYFSYDYGMGPTNNQGDYSPFSGSTVSQGASIPSPMSTSESPLHGIEYTILQQATVAETCITIIEQPPEKFRFRYESEMNGTHGSLVNSGSNRKKQVPTVQLHNYSDKAIVRCTLVTSEEGRRIPHAHRLIRREGNEFIDDPHHVEVSPDNGFIAQFHGLGIIHTPKGGIKNELIRKMRNEALENVRRKNINECLGVREEAEIRANAECYQKCLNLNSVTLCFQAFIMDHNNIMSPLTEPVYSNPISNLKSALTGELKICRIDKNTGSCEGAEEIFIFVEKVKKNNIKIKFFELNDKDVEMWSAYGKFSELDVHHQFAIAFKTPAYKDINITTPKEVFLQLERISDSDCSEPIKFTYKPSDRIMGRKRPRISYSGSIEFSQFLSSHHSGPLEGSFPAEDTREISIELKKLLANGCTETELWQYFRDVDLDDIDKYVTCAGQMDDNALTFDGPSVRQYHDDVAFARNILVEAIKYIKLSPKSGKESLQNLLKHRSTYGDTPLHSALRYGQRDTAKYLLMLINTDTNLKTLVNEQNSSGKTPLHYAVLQNQPDIAKTLLVLGADPNRRDDHGFSPLHSAVKIPDAAACVDVLLSQEVIDVEAHNDVGWTALQLAAEAGSYNAVRSLVRGGADVNNTDMSYGRTALHIAVEGGHKDIVEFLLKETKIDVNKKNFSGNTALHSAVVYTGTRAKELCELLLQHGADPRIKNDTRESKNLPVVDQVVTMKKEAQEQDEEQISGQSSFDLASHKPDILQLLSNQGNDSTNDILSTPIKQEASEYDPETDWLSSDDKENLSAMLDKTKGWEKLAKRLKFEYLLKTLEHNTSSPSLLLLNYIDVSSSVSLKELERILRDLEETDAADLVMHIISTYS